MKRIIRTLVCLALAGVFATAFPTPTLAKKSNKARFYDFSDQLIDGDVKKPSTIWMESRTRAKFEKLLKLKKSFKPALFETSKEPILK
ncbi:MAG TPA: hypothetical protein DCQ06_08205 [Myxococcales bacterium]|nr:hypothetical protein [Myxococcales bacterium]HAN31567.1 hypothetical protein [Myxococcales bacterium]|tara:strand:+ start:272 stop:535 length:264 start_codon:yes stop_codon:yes gene_type:complete